jgi:type IV pilus assembly protein PilW
MKRLHAPTTQAPAQRGLTLIELMVALLIGSIMSLAIFGVLSTFEGRKRTTTAVNDASQAGNYALYVVDRLVRSAGSGLSQGGPQPRETETRKAMAYGCRLLVTQGGTQLWPRATALPAPFGNLDTGTAGTLRLAPVIIAPSQSEGLGINDEPSDLLVVMSGAGGWAEVPLLMTAAVAANTVPLRNTVGLGVGDLLVLADQPSSLGQAEDCMVQQVGSLTATSAGLSGTYAAATIAGVSQAIYDNNSMAMKIGHRTDNRPSFFALGVGAGATLMSYDLLEVRSPALQAVAENVLELHALYGIDADGDGAVDDWIDPRTTTTGAYAMANLMSGTTAAAAAINQIKALRIGLVLRSSLQEKADDAAANPFTPGNTLTLFADVDGGAHTRTRTLDTATGEHRFRYRVVEATVPVRNSMLIPALPTSP